MGEAGFAGAELAHSPDPLNLIIDVSAPGISGYQQSTGRARISASPPVCPTTGGARPSCPTPTTTAPPRVDLPSPDGLQLETAMLLGGVVTEAVVDYVRRGLNAGMELPGPADPELNTFRVVAKEQ